MNQIQRKIMYKPHGKGLIFGELAKPVTMRLYSWEKELVKNYIKCIRKIRKETMGYNK